MDNNQTHQGSPKASDMEAWIFIWISALAVFLLVPICATSYRRQLCLQRLKERRWNVNLEVESDEWRRSPSPQAIQTSQTEDAQIKPQLSKQEEEDIRRVFLVELLDMFSQPVNQPDLRRRSKNPSKMNNTHVGRDEEAGVGLYNGVESPEPVKVIDATNDQFLCESNGNLSVQLSSTSLEDVESIVIVPLAGVAVHSATEVLTREVPNGCSICFCEYIAGDRVTWSSNAACAHVFHEDCVLKWFMAVGKKELRRRRRENIELNSTDPVQQATDFPILCPCCRQTFVSSATTTAEQDPNAAEFSNLSDCPTTSTTIESHPSTTTEDAPEPVGEQRV